MAWPVIRRWIGRLGRGVRILLIIAVVASVITAVLFLLVEPPAKASQDSTLEVAKTLAAAISALAAVGALLLNWRLARKGISREALAVAPQTLRDERLVDRSAEMQTLVAHVKSSSVVSCHGLPGSGKSFLLEHVADAVNGFRRPPRGHPRLRRMTAALYFDLADASGFVEVERQLCRAAKLDGTWPDFVALVERTYKRGNVLLILDNVNSPGLWAPLGRAARAYLASRPGDRIVFGSIEPVVLDNLRVAQFDVNGLDLQATGELAAYRGITLDAVALADLHERTRGLPVLIRARTSERALAKPEASDDAVLIPEQRLTPELRRMLAYTSLLALLTRQIPRGVLERCPIAYLDAQIAAAEQASIVTRVPGNGRVALKIHDERREAALRRLKPEVGDAAALLFERAYERGRLSDAALYGMFTNPDRIGHRFDEVLERVIVDAVAAKNFTLMRTLHERAGQNEAVLDRIEAASSRRDLWRFGRASELAGLGDYVEADETLLDSSLTQLRLNERTRLSDLLTQMFFLQADLAHLQNRYDDAAELFTNLGVWAKAHGRPGLVARCTWGTAHVLRHQGRELGRALDLFADAERMSLACGDLFTRTSAVTGATGIRVFSGTVTEEDVRRLDELEHELAATSGSDGFMLKIWKYQAQVAWHRGAEETALQLVGDAIVRALELNDRALYNLTFEQAEFKRQGGSPAAAARDYETVLAFARRNRDRNLIANAQLGLVLADLAAGSWAYHGSAEAARALALEAQRIAAEADIQATAQLAGRIAAMVDAQPNSPSALRLIVF